MNKQITVIGAGAWGTALADLLARKGHPVRLWVFEEDLARQIRETRENGLYLSGVPLSGDIRPSSSPEESCTGSEIFLVVTPSHVIRKVLDGFRPSIPAGAVVIGASKGIENDTLMTVSQILPEALPHVRKDRFAYLSGPSFASEVARELPTAVTAASASREVASLVQSLFTMPYFRVYTTSDVMGVELGGAVKNVMAIAAGISDGLDFGSNARAALITRGLAEMSRLGAAMGGDPMTFMGLAGLGDLVLTCTGDLSRNRSVGLKLGRGASLEQILAGERTVAEGVRTTRSVYGLSCRHGVDMPITRQVYKILFDGVRPRDAVRALMSRDPREELDEMGGGPKTEWRA